MTEGRFALTLLVLLLILDPLLKCRSISEGNSDDTVSLRREVGVASRLLRTLSPIILTFFYITLFIRITSFALYFFQLNKPSPRFIQTLPTKYSLFNEHL